MRRFCVPVCVILAGTAVVCAAEESRRPVRYGAEMTVQVGQTAGDLSLSGVFPPEGNRYRIDAPLDGSQWGLRGEAYAGPIRLRAEWATASLDRGTLTDRDWYADGRIWAHSRSISDGEVRNLAMLAGWEIFDDVDAWGAHVSLDLGAGLLNQDVDIEARRKRFVVPAQTPAPGVFLGETDGLFLEDDIATDGFLVYLRGQLRVPVHKMVLTTGLEGRYMPDLETEFREVRYRDRPEISVRRGIDLSGDGWGWEAFAQVEPRSWKLKGVWFLRGGYRALMTDVSGSDLDWSYIDPDMKNSLEIDQGVLFFEAGVRF